ncbi:hypothetical protein V7S43_009376 [Phytophthora oleae]|uniref:Uncharacterized protein n=1 Tax=Phytophthora oleae TaxID=2107226 RepID=A0ABD3FI03_9STRA
MVWCNGVNRQGNPCGSTRNLDKCGYCTHHRRQGLPKCQGAKVGTKSPCKKPAKEGSDFCCVAHEFPNEHIAPKVLDPLGFCLRDKVEADVVRYWRKKDVYNQEKLDLKTPYALDLDHIAEKQLFTTALSMTGLRNGDKDLDLATEYLRDEVVNKVQNLCLTRPDTNRIKGSAVYHFLDDWRTEHLAEKTFASYLLDEQRLDRDVTGRITRKMGRALKRSQRMLSDEGDTPVLERVSEHLQKIYVAMELKAPRKK